MISKLTALRWIALLAVVAMAAVACGDSSEETTTTTTEPPTTTTAPPADDGGDDMGDDEETSTTTSSTEAPSTTEAPEPDPEPMGFPVKMSLLSDPTTTNPWAQYDTESDVWNSYVLPGNTSLYGYSFPTYTFGPSLASDIDPPPVVADGDNWSVTVNLRDDVKWSDGTPITAGDMQFTWETIDKYGGLGGNFASNWPYARVDDPETDEVDPVEGVLDVEALSDTQVKITFNFEAGLTVWPLKVGVAIILQEAYWKPIVDRSDIFEDLYSTEAIGYPNASAYNSVEREAGAFWRNQAIDDYWDSGSKVTAYANGAVSTDRNGEIETYGGEPTGDVLTEYVEGPNPSEVTYSFYSDQNSAVLALTNGEIDFMLNPSGLQRGLQSLVFGAPDVNVIVNESNGMRYFAFNMRKFPMSDKAFRRAIACRIDKGFMADTVLGGAAIPISSMVPPGNSYWASPDIMAPCEGLSEQERLDEAVQILTDAGWSWSSEPTWDENDGVGSGEGIRGPNGEQLSEMELLAPGPGYDPLRATYSLFIEEWFNDLGIPVKARPTGFSVIVDKVFNQENQDDWDMYILGWGLTPFPDHVLDFFLAKNDTANGGFNTPGFSNDEFEALGEQFVSVKTLEEARDIIRQAEAILAEELPYVVLFTTPIIEAYRNTIEFPYTTTLDGIQNWMSGSSLVSNIQNTSQ